MLENGGDRDQAIAGLLHDVIEDRGVDYPGGVDALRGDIETEFGPIVLRIVEWCTDDRTTGGLSSSERKALYLAHLEDAPPEALLVSCADKLHNARAIVADLRVMGPALFDRFNVGRDGTLGYYESLASVFERRGPGHLAAELRRTVETMKTLAE